MQPFSTTDAARICQISPHTIVKCLDNGTLKCWRVPGSRHRRIEAIDLYEFMVKHGIPLDKFPGYNTNGKAHDDDDRIKTKADGVATES